MLGEKKSLKVLAIQQTIRPPPWRALCILWKKKRQTFTVKAYSRQCFGNLTIQRRVNKGETFGLQIEIGSVCACFAIHLNGS